MRKDANVCMSDIFIKEIRNFFLFLIPCIIILPLAYYLLLLNNELPQLLFGVFAIILSIFTVVQTIKTYFILKLKRYIRKQNKNPKEEIVFWYNADVTFTETSIYLMKNALKSHIVSFSYEQLDRVNRSGTTHLVGTRTVTDAGLNFILIDGTRYPIHYSEQFIDENVKPFILEKNPYVMFNF